MPLKYSSLALSLDATVAGPQRQKRLSMSDHDIARKRVTLTSGNGPTPGVTDKVLDALAARGAVATFLVVANQPRQPGGLALAERAVAEGHRTGHHTATHTLHLGAADDPEAAVAAEITAVERDIDAAGEQPQDALDSLRVGLLRARRAGEHVSALQHRDRRVLALALFQQDSYDDVAENLFPALPHQIRRRKLLRGVPGLPHNEPGRDLQPNFRGITGLVNDARAAYKVQASAVAEFWDPTRNITVYSATRWHTPEQRRNAPLAREIADNGPSP
jgi:hypothetical protein